MRIRNPLTSHVIEVYEEKKCVWLFEIKHISGLTVLSSAVSFTSYDECSNSLNNIFKNKNYELAFISDNNKYKGVIMKNSQVLATTKEHASRSLCEQALSLLFEDTYKLM